MTTRRGGLGRGLGALIPAAEPDVSRETMAAPAVLRLVDPAAIRPNPAQPRQIFEPEALAELVVSLREVGMLQPVVVRPVPDEPEAGYELVMGERRWRAAQQAGLDRIPAIVRATADDAMLRDALLENLHRSQLNPLEEAAAYQQLLAEFGATHEQLAARIGRSRSQVTNMIRLLGLPAAVQRRVAAGVLSAGHARALLAVEDPADQEELASRIVAEGWSVRSTEEQVAVRKSGAVLPGPAAPRTPRTQPAAAAELGQRVADLLDTRVTVEMGRAKGRLSIEVADLDDLARVVELIAGAAAPEAR